MKHYLRFMLVLLLSTVWCVGGYSQTWEKVSLSDLTNEDVFVIVDVTNSVALQNEAVRSKPKGTNISVNSSGDKLLGTISDDLLWNVSKNSDGTYTFYPNGKTNIWLGNIKGETYLSIATQKCKNFTEYSESKYVGLLEKSTNRFIAYSSSSNNDFRCYAKSNVETYKTVLAYFKKVESTKKLTSLAISGAPTKTTYNDGEEFDPTGLVVTGTYDDNTTATITDGITWTKTPATLAVGNTSCSVTATVNGVSSPAYPVTGLTVVKSISLSIDPATDTFVKAPVTVTLTATEGAAVYYTTNGDEPTTSSTKYDAPFEVIKSGTTVKAIAVAEGAEDVKAEATYTIKPDQPVFSDESKTFKDAFDVTLTLPESTDANSKIYYAIGATATAESQEYTRPVNISAENEGDQVILHAVVVDQYGNVGKEKFCTYTKATAIVFDFTGNWDDIKPVTALNNKQPGSQVVAGKELKVDGVVMTATNKKNSTNGTYYTGLYGTAEDHWLRVYGSITFTAPEGYNISEVDFTGSSLGSFSTADKAYKNPTWSGNTHAITFTASGTVQVKTATIKLIAATPVTPEVTSGTLEFKAVSDGIHYATFSSSKNVVFPIANVDVYSYNVSNGKGTQNKLIEYYYEVTDATAGEEGLIDGYYVPANTGVLILSLNTTTPYYFSKNEETTTLPTNQLKPAPVGGGKFEAETGYKYYKLAYDNFTEKTGLGFYWGADNAGAFNVKAGTAYLAVPTSEVNNAKGFAFDGETTGIENVNVAANQSKTIYNLNGQRVSNMSQAGLYIVNGKKVVIRK